MLKRIQRKGTAGVSARGGKAQRTGRRLRVGGGVYASSRAHAAKRSVTKPTHSGLTPVRLRKVPSAEQVAYQIALRDFEVGVRQFQKGSYQKAAEIFQNLTRHPAREVADRARIHLRLCEQRMGRETPVIRTAEEHYLQGIAALNSRQLGLAVEHLSKSDKLGPGREHVQYALGAAYALQGETEQALTHLRAAIQLRAGNRILARRDVDFQALSREPRFQQLLAGGIS